MPTEEEVKDLKEEYSDNSIINNKNTKTDTLYRINLVLILVYYLLLGFFVYSIYSKIKQCTYASRHACKMLGCTHARMHACPHVCMPV